MRSGQNPIGGIGARAFTLIELLVVISIIAVMASLVLPAVAGAQRRAWQIQCISNLRQIGCAVAMYADDFAGYEMPADMGGDIDSWINYVASAFDGAGQLFRCPEMPRTECFNPYGGNSSPYNKVNEASYVLNSIGTGQWASAPLPTDPLRTCGWANGTANPIHTSTVQNPAVTIRVADALAGISSADARGIVTYEETDRGNDITLRDIGIHHNNGFNALMGDGHTEYFLQTLPENWPAAQF